MRHRLSGFGKLDHRLGRMPRVLLLLLGGALGCTMSIFQLSNFAGRPLAALIAGVMLHWLSATQLMISLSGVLFAVSVLALLQI
jgi:hypothetical protein